MKTKIVVSSLDMDRLEALLDALPAAQAQAQQALLGELSRAQVVEPEDMPPDVATMNSRVRFVLDDAAEARDMVLSYPKDMDGSGDRLSILTPVGSALLGLKEGKSIEWTRPDGATFQVKVVEVVYQPERAGELHR
ncbi:nucleoside diphosphate kinase regulator [Pseudoduganella umbonata]|uniref:Nucleoside diphosphate kinase regulator n=1 Tax=Pseudoduganella umbonata TaxID=864828 RepID=A0A4P8HP49_9BURK|nr:nucleoside diphosphate kinase regulator [Pseudoduganella umbonata]MBB3221015.1 regulator of nucleoside diphosphate kinase [Pseudoduganella umbonata]QCP10220.1 nucleoside diphosphate kinase regulator [Pseudoduganella umbonata]